MSLGPDLSLDPDMLSLPSEFLAEDTDPVSSVVSGARSRRSEGRGLLIGRTGDRLPSMRAVFAETGAGWYAIVALSIFAALDAAMGYIIVALGPNISNTLGMSPSSFAMLASQRQTLFGLAAFQFAYVFYRRDQRALFAKQFGLQYGPALVVASFITWSPAMTVAVGSAGVGAAVVWSSHRPLIMDLYPPGSRFRAISIHQGAIVLGGIVGPLLVSLLAGPLGLTWRGVFLVCGLIFIPIALLGWRLKDPGYGRFDSDRVASLMHNAPAVKAVRHGDQSELTFWEAVRRVWLIPTVRRMLAVWAVLGVAVTPLVNYQGFWLQEQFGLSTTQRAMFLAGAWTLSIPVLWFLARRGERAWLRDPSMLIRLTSKALVALACGLVLAIVPVLGVSFVGFSVRVCSRNSVGSNA